MGALNSDYRSNIRSLEPIKNPVPSTSPSLPPPVPFQPLITPTESIEWPNTAPIWSTKPLVNSNRYEDLLERIEERRWQLREAREKLHGARVRLRQQRGELRTTRNKALGQAATAFDRLRKYLLEWKVDLPQEVQYAFEEAEVWRERVGAQEDDYEKAEAGYNLDEWNYTEKESRFVDDMYGSEPLTSAPPTTKASDIEDLTRFSLGTVGAHDVVDASEGESLLLEHLEAEDNSNTMEPLRNGSLDATQSMQKRPSSSLSLNMPREQLAARLASRPHSESDLMQVKLDWSDTRERIEAWLLDALQQSNIQKTQLKNLLQTSIWDYEDWWELVVKHWKSNSPGSTVFHTGDTTISRSATKQSDPPPVLDKNFAKMTTLDLDAEPATSSPFVGSDHTVDALYDTYFPVHVKSSNFLGPTPAYVSSATTELRYASISSSEPTLDPKLFRRHYVPEPCDEHDSSRDFSGNVDTVLPVHEPSKKLPMDTHGAENLHQSDESRPRISHEYQHPSTFDSSATPKLQLPTQELASSPEPSTSMTATGTTLCIHPDSYAISTASASTDEGATTAHTPTPLDPSDSSGHTLPSLFIRVQSPEPWNLPVVRLTPLPSPSSGEHSSKANTHQAKDVPFVDFPSSPFRLPGPSKIPEVYSNFSFH
jgi:hypothetical protein